MVGSHKKARYISFMYIIITLLRTPVVRLEPALVRASNSLHEDPTGIPSLGIYIIFFISIKQHFVDYLLHKL